MGGDPFPIRAGLGTGMGRRPFMLGRARLDAEAVAGDLRAAGARPGPPEPGEDGQRRRDCQAEGVRRHWSRRRRDGRLPEDGRPLAEPEGRTAEGKRMTGGKRSRRLA